MPHQIPKIDLSPLWDESPGGEQLVTDQLKYAYQTFGFAYLINHNISRGIFERAFSVAKKFHDLPLEEKLKIKQNQCFRGYVPLNGSKLTVSTLGEAKKPNQLEAFVMAFEADAESKDYAEGRYLCGDNQFPERMPELKEIMMAYRDAMLALAFRLLRVFSIAFEIPYATLERLFQPPTYFLRLQHYPEQPACIPSDVFGIAPHTDYGFFTLLAQSDIEGLEVLTPTKEWIEVPPLNNSLVLNTGDMFKRITNGQYLSTPHRVINRSGKERFSIPFFFEPNMRAKMAVFDKFITSKDPKKDEDVRYGDYLLDRIQGNYGLGRK